VTIRYGDGRTWTGSAGFADVAGHVPVTATTAFAAGSITKTFTSAVVMRLVAEGRIALDAPIARYLRSPKLDPRITVRMLLDHTSGLFDVFLAPGIDHALQSAPTARWSTARALTYLRKPYFPPGRGWHYSNTNYLVLGLLVERVTGRSLAAEIRARILDPLDLDDTWFQGAERPRAVLAHGYRLAGPSASPRVTDLADGTGIAPFASVATALDGAGSVASTTADLARWASRLYGGGVLSTSTLGEMLADQQRTSGYIPGVLYGLGVQTYTIDGWTTLGHSGRVLGFRGAVRYVPAAGLTIAVLTNQSRADVAPLVARLLADVLPTSGPRLGPVAGRVR
jgi:D-alanyl-D-alanine carboxypeptidase